MHHLLLLHGAAVVGKRVCLAYVVEKHGYNVVTTYTAREPDKEGTTREFRRRNQLVGTCDVVYWLADHVYGLRTKEVRQALQHGNVVAIVPSFDAIRSLRAHFPEARVVWIERGLTDEQTRAVLRDRGHADVEIMLRLNRARALEIEYPWHASMFDFVVKNDGSLTWLRRQLGGYVLSLDVESRVGLLAPGPADLITRKAAVFSVAEAMQARLLVRRPEELRALDPLSFERFVASLFADEGYDVRLTPKTRDGGFDILLVQSKSFFPQLYLVECKRYSEDRPVGVQPVRQLYGLVGSTHANGAVLVTTSRFTRDAYAFQETVGYQLSLRDHETLVRWLARIRGLGAA